MVLFKYLGRKAVAGCPIVDVGQIKKQCRLFSSKYLCGTSFIKSETCSGSVLKNSFANLRRTGVLMPIIVFSSILGISFLLKFLYFLSSNEKSLVWISVCLVFIEVIIPLFFIFVEEKDIWENYFKIF